MSGKGRRVRPRSPAPGEHFVLGLILVLVVVWLALVAVLWVGTLWGQGYFYEEPTEDLYWRAPAAASALAAFFAAWCLVDYRAADSQTQELPYETLLRFSPREDRELAQFWSIKRRGPSTQEILFKKSTGPRGRAEYRSEQGQTWVRNDSEGITEAIAFEDNGQKVRLDAELTLEGNFKTTPSRYVESGGRRWEMLSDQPGRVSSFRWGLFFANILLNLFHLALWFVCLWLLLRFQWTHALGLAFAFWLAMLLVLVPMLLDWSLAAARRKPPPQTIAMEHRHVEARMCMMSPSSTT
jgi:hypothetical protein